MINIPFLLRIVLQIIQILLNSGLFGDDDKQKLPPDVVKSESKRKNMARGLAV